MTRIRQALFNGEPIHQFLIASIGFVVAVLCIPFILTIIGG